MDTSRIGQLAASLMDDWSDADGELRTVAIVFEVDYEDSSEVCYRCTDGRRWLQRAFFEQAVLAAEAGDPVEDE